MLDKRILPVGNVEKGEVFEQRITSAKEDDFSCSIIQNGMNMDGVREAVRLLENQILKAR